MAIAVYHYAKCSTCRKALAWLSAHGLPHTKRDLVAEPLAFAEIADLHRRSVLPVNRLFNTSGESYRAGAYKDRLATMSLEAALQALAHDGKLVKRPLVDAGTTVLVGFDEARFTAVWRLPQRRST